MEFLNEVSEKEFQAIKELDKTIPQTPKNGTCYWVKVNENDFLHKIYIIIQGTPQNPIGWERFAYDPCLGCYSRRVYNANYYVGDELLEEYPILQTKYFDRIKKMVENFSREEMIQSPLLYLANMKTGPYVIRESVRRHIAAYINYFILKKEKFEPIGNAICMVADDEQFCNSRIPKDFC